MVVNKFFNIVSIFWVIIVCGLLLFGSEREPNNEYYRSAEVFRIENEVAYLEDSQGYVWCVENDTLKMFGRYVLVMDNCGTENITDDIILKVK